MTKHAITNYLTPGVPAAPDNSHVMNGGLFLLVDKVFGEKRLTKKKLNDQDALKVLQKRFSKEVKEIFGILGNFREGLKSFDVFAGEKSAVANFTMFH